MCGIFKLLLVVPFLQYENLQLSDLQYPVNRCTLHIPSNAHDHFIFIHL